ncbi:MAG: head GIN domain-containing protein [Pirellulaceae bacterium]
MVKYIPLAFIPVFLSGCMLIGISSGIPGSGTVKQEDRAIDSFHAIDVSGAGTLKFKQSDEVSLSIETDDNLLEKMITEVNDGTLKIYNSESISPTKGPIITIAGPSINSCKVSGAYKVELANVESDALKLSISGASKISATGNVSNLTIDASGAISVDSLGLIADDVSIDVSGASNLDVLANKKLKVDASGATKVRYKGDSGVAVEQNTSGVSKVSRMDD